MAPLVHSGQADYSLYLIVVVVYYCSLIVYQLSRFLKMACPNLWWLQWGKAVFQPVIFHHMFWDGLFDSFGEETTLDDDCD